MSADVPEVFINFLFLFSLSPTKGMFFLELSPGRFYQSKCSFFFSDLYCTVQMPPRSQLNGLNPQPGFGNSVTGMCRRTGGLRCFFFPSWKCICIIICICICERTWQHKCCSTELQPFEFFSPPQQLQFFWQPEFFSILSFQNERSVFPQQENLVPENRGVPSS